MPYRPAGPPHCPPPPIVPVDSSIDIKLKILEGKLVPKDTSDLTNIPDSGELKSTDYFYVSDDTGNTRKLATNKIAGKEALSYPKVVTITNSQPDIVYDPTGKVLELDTSSFNREPVEGESFTVYLKVLNAYQDQSAFWLVSVRAILVNTDITLGSVLENGIDITSEIVTDVKADIQTILDTKISATQDEPIADNPNPQPVLVLLDHEPVAKYKGYFYIIGTDDDPSYIEGTTIELGDGSYVDLHIVRFGSGEAIENHTIIL